MKRRDFIAGTGALVAGIAAAGASRAYEKRETGDFPRIDHAANGKIRVAFAMANGATVIDFAGPWEVFQDVMIPSPGGTRMPFELFTVGESRESVRATGGLHIIPDYTFETTPTPNVISRSRASRLGRPLGVVEENSREDRHHHVCLHRCIPARTGRSFER